VNISVPAAGDQDGDGDPDNTDPQPTDGCVWGSGQVLANTTTAWRNADCDGDGVTNYKEVTGTDNNPSTTADTNPLDGCSYNAVDQVLVIQVLNGNYWIVIKMVIQMVQIQTLKYLQQ
jgi:hypothetical protein